MEASEQYRLLMADVYELAGLSRRTSEAIAREHELATREVVLIRTGSLPKTTSGKVQRQLTRQMFLTGALLPV